MITYPLPFPSQLSTPPSFQLDSLPATQTLSTRPSNMKDKHHAHLSVKLTSTAQTPRAIGLKQQGAAGTRQGGRERRGPAYPLLPSKSVHPPTLQHTCALSKNNKRAQTSVRQRLFLFVRVYKNRTCSVPWKRRTCFITGGSPSKGKVK